MTEAELRHRLEMHIQDAIDAQMPFEGIYSVLCGLSQRLALVWASEVAIKLQTHSGQDVQE